MHDSKCDCVSNLYFCVCTKIHVAMSKGNLFMGNASGKLADVVLYRNAGAQVARLRVRNPKNPRSEQQLIQRVIQSTASKAYSVLQAICNHAFEGKQSRTANQSEFMKLNVARDRYRVSVAPMGWRSLSNFNSRELVEPLANNYIVASGSLPEFKFSSDGDEFIIGAGSNVTADDTYQQICDKLGLQRGDQITVFNIKVDDNGVMSNLNPARIILEPNDGDMTSKFLGAAGAINKANEKNEGDFTVNIAEGTMSISFNKSGGAGSIIISRYAGGKWLRSTARIFVSKAIANAPTLGAAVDSWKTAVSSDKYLNQAES